MPAASATPTYIKRSDGFEPLLENGSIHGDVSQKPIMRNSVETGFDVALENPLRVWSGQCVETLFDRIGAGPLLTKPVGVVVSSGFLHRIECQQMQCLLGSIFHSGNSERAHRFAIRFRDVNASERLRLIAPTLECMYGLYLLFWCVPDFLVHARGFF